MGIHQRPAEDPSLQSQRHQVVISKSKSFGHQRVHDFDLQVGGWGGGRVQDRGQQYGGKALGDRQREQKDELWKTEPSYEVRNCFVTSVLNTFVTTYGGESVPWSLKGPCYGLYGCGQMTSLLPPTLHLSIAAYIGSSVAIIIASSIETTSAVGAVTWHHSCWHLCKASPPAVSCNTYIAESLEKQTRILHFHPFED